MKRSLDPHKQLTEARLEDVRGGATAPAPAPASAPSAGVDINPLYMGSDTGADNPLFA